MGQGNWDEPGRVAGSPPRQTAAPRALPTEGLSSAGQTREGGPVVPRQEAGSVSVPEGCRSEQRGFPGCARDLGPLSRLTNAENAVGSIYKVSFANSNFGARFGGLMWTWHSDKRAATEAVPSPRAGTLSSGACKPSEAAATTYEGISGGGLDNLHQVSSLRLKK